MTLNHKTRYIDPQTYGRRQLARRGRHGGRPARRRRRRLRSGLPGAHRYRLRSILLWHHRCSSRVAAAVWDAPSPGVVASARAERPPPMRRAARLGVRGVSASEGGADGLGRARAPEAGSIWMPIWMLPRRRLASRSRLLRGAWRPPSFVPPRRPTPSPPLDLPLAPPPFDLPVARRHHPSPPVGDVGEEGGREREGREGGGRRKEDDMWGPHVSGTHNFFMCE